MRDLQQVQGMGMGMGGPMGAQPDMRKVFKTEKENLDLTNHKWEFKTVEQDLLIQFKKAPVL